MASPTDASLVFVDPETEAEILAGFLQRVPEILNSGLFDDLVGSQFSVDSFRWLVDEVLRPRKDPYIAWPTLHELLQQKWQQNADGLQKHILTLQRLYELDVSWIRDAISNMRRFIAFQQANSAVRKCFEGYSRTKDVTLALRDLHEGSLEAQRILRGRQAIVVDYAATWADREALRKHKRDNPELYPSLRLGIARFDSQVKMEAGTVTNFLAPAKRYKSIVLLSVAHAAVLQGFNVALVVLENTLELTLNRLDALFGQINYDRLVNYLKTPEEKARLDAIMARVHSWQHRLKIIKGEPGQMSVVGVEHELDILRKREGFVAEVKVYDYLNIMATSNGIPTDDHIGQSQLVWDLQSVAKKPGESAIVATATQANMSGNEVDKQGKPVKVQRHHQGRALGIVQAVDSTVAINMELGEVDETGLQRPPTIIFSILYLRDGSVTDPDIRLVSEIDKMCVDREIRRLWDEVDDGWKAGANESQDHQ